MKLRNILAISLLATSLTSCFEDETTLGSGAISEIVIDTTSIQKVYNINKNETLTITPVITQTNREKAVSYTWEINLKTYSKEQEFVYVGKELGSYQCRLILENSDGKTFYPFELHVNSPYEEGITVISKDTQGNGMLSFMLSPADGSEPTGFMTGDQFTGNNAEIPFAANPIDMTQSSGSLIIACQGSEDNTTPATIYYLNEKTFVVENMLTASEFPDFKPTYLAIPTLAYQGISYPILCENGQTYEFSVTEGAITKAVKLPHTYAQTAISYTHSASEYDMLFWDKEINALCLLYNGYGPYYCSKTYHAKRDTLIKNPSMNYFNGLQIRKMTLVQTTNTLKGPEVLVITNNAFGMIQRSLLAVDFWTYDNATMENVLVDNGGYYPCGFGELSLNETTPCIANDTYFSMLFAEGNTLKRWHYDVKEHKINNADVFLTLPSETAVITGLELSADHTRTYVAFYEPEQTGLNGSVWVIDTDKGDVLQKYDNVCYQPVKIMYKKK